MFVLLAGPHVAADDEDMDRMAAALRGGTGLPRRWRDHDRNAAAASLAADFTPEDGFDAQPLVARERVFVCQARIDNRQELLDRLGLPGDAPLADSALLAAAYDRWGEACVDRLVGDFAFAAWHRADGRVVAAVDPGGARRLLWTRIGSGLALSAQLPALLAHLQVSREPDLGALAQLLDIGLDRAATPFAAITGLPGGHLLAWRDGQLRVRRWWTPEWRATIWHRDPRDYVEQTRELLIQSTAAQLRSSGPISSTLSGGLDSGCVTAIAARLLAPDGKRLTAYTSVPEQGLVPSERPDWEADDSAYAAEVAALYGNVDHRLVPPGGRCVIDVAEAVLERSLTPTKAATNLLWTDAVAESMAQAGSSVLLVGQQGNGAFSWRGEATVWELAALGRLRAAFGQAALEAAGRQRSLAWVLAGAARDGLRRLRHRPAGEEVHNPGLGLVREDYRPSPAGRANEYRLARGSRRFRAAVVTTPKHVFWPEPVQQWGIELRDPTADRRLLETLLRYPQAAFRAGGRPRGLAREAAAGLLPDRVRYRLTQGAQVPEAPSLIAAHAPRYRDSLATMRGSPRCRELLDLDALEAAVDGFVRGRRDYHLALFVDRAFCAGLFLAMLDRKP